MLRRIIPAAVAGLLVLSLGVAGASAKTLKPTGEKTAHRVGPGFFERTSGQERAKAPPLRKEHPRKLRRLKVKAAHEHGKPPTSPAPLSPAAVTHNWDGLLWSSNTAFLLVPPDTTGAIGPNHYMEFVNGVISPYDRTTLVPTGSAQSGAFTGPTGRNVFDIQIQWDQEANRWFYSAISDQGDTANQNFMVFGWSKTANATGSLASSDWCKYAITTDAQIDDYDKLGHDANHIIIGSNIFTGNTFNSARIWAIPKPANGSTTCPTTFNTPFFGSSGSPLKTADNDNAFTPVPANTVNPTGGNGYVVAADDPSDHSGTSNQIMVWHVAGTATSPTLVQDGNIGVSNYQVPANVPQPGSTRVIDSSDTRLTQAVENPDPDASGAEAVWTQHTIDGSGTPSVVRWYELIPSLCSPNPPNNPATCPAGAKRQEGTIVGTNSTTDFTFNGAISPSTAGNTAMIDYNQGSSNATTGFVTVREQSRVGGTPTPVTPLNAMGSESTLVNSSPNIDAETLTCATVCRWGDYAAASPDPSSSTLIWGSNQYNGVAASGANKKLGWKTRNFAITP